MYAKTQRFYGYGAKRQRGRVFQRAKAGVNIARHRGEQLRWLTLTSHSGADNSRLNSNFEVLRKRIEHVSFEKDGFNPFRLEDIKVETDEGNGVIHILYKANSIKGKSRQLKINSHCRRAKGGCPVNKKYDIGFIAFQWLKQNWAEIQGNPNPNSQNVYIEFVYGSAERIAGYLLQYVAGQNGLKRMAYSHGWLYRGCVKDWNNNFKPRVAEVYSYRDSLTDAQFNADMRAIYSDWDKWILEKVV